MRMVVGAVRRAVAVLVAVAFVWWTAPVAREAEGTGPCAARMDAPVRGGVAVRAFDGPELPWQSGHRGVDMAASQGEPLLAPIDATVSFVGTVGGKRVVSLAHGDWTLTFEPAVTDLRNGSRVARGERCGTVGTGSDHCDGSCVHWGIRLQGRRYLDPATFLSASRIRLVPVR